MFGSLNKNLYAAISGFSSNIRIPNTEWLTNESLNTFKTGNKTAATRKIIKSVLKIINIFREKEEYLNFLLIMRTTVLNFIVKIIINHIKYYVNFHFHQHISSLLFLPLSM